MLRHTGLRPHPLLCSYKNLGNPQVPSSSLHISLPQETVFLQATFHGTNREYSYPNKEYIDLIFVSLIVFLIDKYHKTISPESEVYNTLAVPRGPPHQPTGPNSFVFTYIFTEKHPRRPSAPPNGVRSPAPQREILDPLLLCSTMLEVVKWTSDFIFRLLIFDKSCVLSQIVRGISSNRNEYLKFSV